MTSWRVISARRAAPACTWLRVPTFINPDGLCGDLTHTLNLRLGQAEVFQTIDAFQILAVDHGARDFKAGVWLRSCGTKCTAVVA